MQYMFAPSMKMCAPGKTTVAFMKSPWCRMSSSILVIASDKCFRVLDGLGVSHEHIDTRCVAPEVSKGYGKTKTGFLLTSALLNDVSIAATACRARGHTLRSQAHGYAQTHKPSAHTYHTLGRTRRRPSVSTVPRGMVSPAGGYPRAREPVIRCASLYMPLVP